MPMRLRVLLSLLLLVGLSAPLATSNPQACSVQPCAAAPPCAPVEFTGGQPGLKVWPLLNLVYVNLSCLTTTVHT